MTAARHARDGQYRDGQYRDDLNAWLRDTWVLIRLSWILLTILISRRVGRAAGGAPATTPVAGALEVPVLAPPDGAGTSPYSGESGSRAAIDALMADLKAGRLGRLPDAAPGEVTAPAIPGAATRPDWVWHAGQPGTPMPPTYAVRHDGIIAVSATGSLAIIPDRPLLPVARCRETGTLEALALPVVSGWATDARVLRQLLGALRAMA